MAQYLYQQIMDVPGLTGSWKDRLAQYYKKLTGKTYRGTLDEGLYMLDQIKKKNYGLPEVAKTTTKTTSVAQPPIAEQYAKPITDKAEQIAKIPTFAQTLPFYEAWRGMVPQATAAASSQINPEIMRQYNQSYRDYMSGITSSGGQRFGTGLSGIGNLKASAERSRQSLLNDWLNQYQQGFKSFFYEPSQQAWESSRMQGIQPDSSLTRVPTWDEMYSKFGNIYGVGTSPSPLYG